MFQEIEEVPKRKLASLIEACAESIGQYSSIVFVGDAVDVIPHVSNNCKITQGLPKTVDILVCVGEKKCSDKVVGLAQSAQIVILEHKNSGLNMRRGPHGNIHGLLVRIRNQIVVVGSDGECDYVVYGHGGVDLSPCIKTLKEGELDMPIRLFADDEENQSSPNSTEVESVSKIVPKITPEVLPEILPEAAPKTTQEVEAETTTPTIDPELENE